MNILLVGGTGVISTDIMNLCIEKGYNVYVLNRGNRNNLLNPKVKLINANIINAKLVKEKLQDLYFDVVVDFLIYDTIQLENSISIFAEKCKQFVFISSTAVYNRGDGEGLITEGDTLLCNPVWKYSIDKVKCEELLIKKCSELDLSYTIVRPSITYGNTRIPYGLMPNYGFHWTLISRILNEKPILVWDGGKTICSLTHTIDFAKGFVGLLNNKNAFNQAFHIVGDNQYTWLEVLNTISKILGKDIKYADIPSEFIIKKMPGVKGELLGDRSIHAKYCNNKLKSVVPEFTSDIELFEGITRAINYYKENDYLQGIDYSWDAKMDRLINSYYKKNEPEILKNLNFINYLGTPFKDKFTYLMNRYFFLSLILHYFNFIARAFRRTQKILISNRVN